MQAIDVDDHELADDTGKNITTVWRWKSGNQPVPKYVETILKLRLSVKYPDFDISSIA